MKKIMYLVIIILIIFIIYSLNHKKEKIVFSIGSNNGDIIYEIDNARITDIIIGIKSNKKIGDYYIQHILVKATTIELTISKFIILNNYSGVNSQLKDLENLFILLKKYNKEIIKIKLVEESSELAEYTNKKILILCQKYDIMIAR